MYRVFVQPLRGLPISTVEARPGLLLARLGWLRLPGLLLGFFGVLFRSFPRGWPARLGSLLPGTLLLGLLPLLSALLGSRRFYHQLSVTDHEPDYGNDASDEYRLLQAAYNT